MIHDDLFALIHSGPLTANVRYDGDGKFELSVSNEAGIRVGFYLGDREVKLLKESIAESEASEKLEAMVDAARA